MCFNVRSSNLSVPEDADGGRALPSFTPTRRDVSRDPAEKPESSASGSRRSARSSTPEDPSTTNRGANGSGDALQDDSLARANGTVRRSRPHGSASFLLHPRRTFLARSKRDGNSGGDHNETDRPDPKGKRPREESEIILPKRRARDVRHEKSLSLGGSPLATEIKREMDNGIDQDNDILLADTDIRRSTFLQPGSTPSPRYGWNLGQSRAPPSVGYDTDPAQIVNMALTLNEKRRRQVSGPRVIPAQTSGARVMSGAISPRTGPGGQFGTPTRASSRLSIHTPESNAMRRSSGKPEQREAFVSGPAALEEDTGEMDGSLPMSHATEMRIQKARTYFELAYEHRRLLSHLPPIRRPGASLQSNESKVYNPLQYSRNRKLRFSEKHPIAAEADGWHDIDQVRSWVNAVIEAHTDTRHDPDECVRLPDLAYSKAPGLEDDDDEDKGSLSLDSPASSVRKLNAKKDAKPRRPRSDWVTHPGDLIADAYWLEQGQNKLKIVDAYGNKIYPADTRFKFSGWRNRTPLHVPERLQLSTSTPEQEQIEEFLPTPPPSALPELPTFTSTHKDKPRKRNRRIKAFKGNLTRDLKDVLLDVASSDSSSSANDSEDEGRTRGRKLISRMRQKSPDGPIADVWKVKSTSNHQSAGKHASSAEHSLDQSANSSKRPSVDHTRLSKFFTRESRTDSSNNHSKTRSEHARRESRNDLPSRDSYDGGNAPRSSAEYDTTAPTSPTGIGFPSIAINLSPPVSRSPSPSKKVLPSIRNPFRDRSQSKVREGIDASDFGIPVSHHQSRHSSNEVDPGHESSDHASRGTSPMTKSASALTKSVSKASTSDEPPNAADDHRGSTGSKMSSKSTHADGHHSKVRGIFKGGRIAELVGNEVSKVGDYIWKRDIPTSIRRRDSVSSSINSGQASGSDDELSQNGFAYKTPPQHEKRFSSSETDAQRTKRLSPSDSLSSPESGEKVDPKYHNPNLPSFTSPFEKDRDTQDEKKRNKLSPTQSAEQTKQEQDHISHLAAEHRNATKSPRLDRLAPPKLNMSRSTSPGGPFTMIDSSRRSSYGFNDGDRDMSKSRNASQMFNHVLDKTNDTMVTGLTNIYSTESRSRSRVDLFRTISRQSGSSAPAEIKDVSKRDIAFTSALLISIGVKAREIDMRANAFRDPLPTSLLNTIEPGKHLPQPLRIRRKDEHVFAARNLMARLEKDGQRFEFKLLNFQSSVSPNLHRLLQGLEDLVDNGLTPRVRKCGDEAGELSMKLSTTSTLAVKDVNERIDAAMRRRRRGPVRWLRRSGYLAIEWVVVALLWGIWAVVTALRVVRAFFVFFVRLVRWLLFL